MTIFGILETVYNKKDGTTSTTINTAFQSINDAKVFLKRMAIEDDNYKLDASEKILIWNAKINTFTREIVEIKIW